MPRTWLVITLALMLVGVENSFAEVNLFSDSNDLLASASFTSDSEEQLASLEDPNLFLNSDNLVASLPPSLNDGEIIPASDLLANSNLFSNSDQFTASLLSTPGSQDILLDGTAFGNDNSAANPENLGDEALSSSCSNGDSVAPARRLRARGLACSAGNSPSLKVPTFPDLDDVENSVVAAERTQPRPLYQRTVRVGGRTVASSEAEFYCHYGQGQFPGFTIPVCAAKKFRGSSASLPDLAPLIYTLSPSRLLVPGLWQCRERNFYCCQFWEPILGSGIATGLLPLQDESLARQSYMSLVTAFREFTIDPSQGTGTLCINLQEAGWTAGYDQG